MFRHLIRLSFPRAFRRRFGRDLADATADRVTVARRRGRAAGSLAWVRAAADLLSHGIAERRAERRRGAGPRRHHMFHALTQDIAYALRTFRARPGFTAVALVTLALGIGANTAIFSVVHAVMLRDLPYPDGEHIVRVYEWNREGSRNRGVANPRHFDAWERENTTFETFAAMVDRRATLTGAGLPERLLVQDVTPAFFEVMGVQPELGRWFDATRVDRGDRLALMAHDIWTTGFGADPSIVGSPVTLEGERWTVVGVMPESFDYPAGTAFWRGLHLSAQDRAGGRAWYLDIIGRLRPGVGLDDAQVEMDTISDRITNSYDETGPNVGAWLVGLRDDLTYAVSDGLRLLQAIVLLVLLIACANLANLLLAAAGGRRRELAIRASIGAGRARIARQLVTESVVLAVAGGGLGVLLAVWGVPALVAQAPEAVRPGVGSIEVSGVALAFTLSVSVVCGLVAGAAPALLFSRPDVLKTMRDDSPGASGGGTGTRLIRSGLVAAQVAFAFVLLCGATLLVTSFMRLTSQDPGFETSRLLTAEITLQADPYSDREVRRLFWADLMDGLGGLPGVTRVAGSTALPFSNWESQSGFELDGVETTEPLRTSVRTVTPAYFDVMNIPLLAGRAFSDGDVAGAERVAVVNEAFAQRFLAGRNVVGQRIRRGREAEDWSTIVGVVGDTKHVGLDREANPELYSSTGQSTPAFMTIALRTAGDPAAAADAVKAAVAELDPGVPVQSLASMDTLIGTTTSERRFHMTLVASFGVLAGLLSAVGIFGVTSYVVGLRSRELAIRRALGARPGGLLALVTRQGMLPVAAGLTVGLVAVVNVSHVLESELFGIEPTEPAALAATAVGFVVIAAASCYLPARRALAIEPLDAMRDR